MLITTASIRIEGSNDPSRKTWNTIEKILLQYLDSIKGDIERSILQETGETVTTKIVR